MAKLRLISSCLTLVPAALFALSCGSSSQSQLQSITLSPATADAQNYPNGQVQFTASGSYGNPSRTVTPLPATWGACYQFATTSAVSVTREGLAQCAPGATGTYTIWANDPIDVNSGCPAVTACGGGCTVQGNAQLTCP